MNGLYGYILFCNDSGFWGGDWEWVWIYGWRLKGILILFLIVYIFKNIVSK